MSQETCESCALPLKPDDKFCGSCGTPVSAAADAVATPAVDLPTPSALAGSSRSSSLGSLKQWAGSLNKRTLLFVGAGVVALAVVVALGIGIGSAVRGGSSGSNTSAQAPAQPDTVDNEPSDATVASPVAGETATEAPTEAPAAGPWVFFQSSSGNIRCEIDPRGVICQQGETKYPKPSQACAGGPSGTVIGLDKSGVTWPCLSTDVTTSDILPYDVPYTAYGFTCSINYDRGITCTNGQGDGFTMEYTAGVRTF
ncbi:MAG: hypothetical protein KF761_13990 [Salinibacterium sp.]|nr:hypothetical protein [Salinibacterium sp.]